MNNVPLSLTGMEFDILTVLMERSGRVVTRDAMMNALKGEEWDVFDRSIDVHISHLRKSRGRVLHQNYSWRRLCGDTMIDVISDEAAHIYWCIDHDDIGNGVAPSARW